MDSRITASALDGRLVEVAPIVDREMARLISALPRRVRSVFFDIQDWMCFESFGVTAYIVGGESPEAHGFLAGAGPLVSFTEPYPVGRADIAGADFTEDADLVVRGLADALRQSWLRCGGGSRPIAAFAGRLQYDEERRDESGALELRPQASNLLSFATGRYEIVESPALE